MYLLRSMVSHGDRCLDRSVNEHKLRRDARRSGDPLSTFAPYDSLSGCPQGKRERERKKEIERASAPHLTADFQRLFFSHDSEKPFVSSPSSSFPPSSGKIPDPGSLSRVRDVDRGFKIAANDNSRTVSMNFDATHFFFFFPAVLLSSKTKYTRDQHARYTTRREPHQLRITADSRSLRIQIQIQTAAHVRRPRLISCSIVASASVSSEILRYILLYQIESYDVDENKLPY